MADEFRLSKERLRSVIDQIDAANAEDPTIVTVLDRRGPKELLHAERMTFWVGRLDPDPDDAQLVAARAHHFRRWEHPRADYPSGRSGYLRWRTAAKRAQAEAVGALLGEQGVDSSFVSRVQSIVRKEGLGVDPAVQVHEDALCLVFLESQLDDLLEDLGEERTAEVLRRTLAKMGEGGIEIAGGLDLSDRGAAVLSAVTSPDAVDPTPPQ